MLTTLVVLALVGGGAAYWARRRRQKGHPAPQLGALRERGPRHLRTGDVVTHLGRDFLVEGVVQLEDGSHRRRLARLVDRDDVLWLLADEQELVLLKPDASETPPTPPPDTLVLGGETFRLRDVGSGRAGRHGDVGARSTDKCRFWRYSGPGGRRAWLDEFKDLELLVGDVVPEQLLEVLPGS